MKKFLLCAAALVVAMSVNAQEKFQVVGEDFGLNGESGTNVEAGTVWYEGTNIKVSNAFATNHKVVDIKNHDYNTVTIDGTQFVTTGGIQGNDNPKDADGGNPALTLKPATSGAVIEIDAAADGWVYIVSKLSTNKQYVVFEEGTAIGYKIAMEVEDPRISSNVLNLEIKGAGEYNQIPEGTQIQWVIREYLNDVEATTAGNGLGVLYFPVAAGCKYLAHATGSKISWSGVLFQANEAASVKVEGVGETAKAAFELLGGEAGISNIVATKDNANAPIYNLAGQQVSKNYKGVVIQNGKKFIQ
jgi:hypothetical protein